jgi:hypothetical protein
VTETVPVSVFIALAILKNIDCYFIDAPSVWLCFFWIRHRLMSHIRNAVALLRVSCLELHNVPLSLTGNVISNCKIKTQSGFPWYSYRFPQGTTKQL